MDKIDKIKWMKSLKIGDEVCDCSFNHQKIIHIIECDLGQPSWTLRALSYIPVWLPDCIDFAIHELVSWIFKRLGHKNIVDKDLVLENGAHCSAMHCCDPVNHEWKHPS